MGVVKTKQGCKSSQKLFARKETGRLTSFYLIMKSVVVALIVISLVVFDACVSAQGVQRSSFTAEDWKELHNPNGRGDRMLDYNAFKAGAKALLASDSKWHLCFRRNIDPCLVWSNNYSKKNTCSPSDTELINTKVGSLLNTVLASRDLEAVDWKEDKEREEDDRKLRGDISDENRERRLGRVTCPRCTSGYLCSVLCPPGRRRTQVGVDKGCVPIHKDDFGSAEKYADSVKKNMISQCKDLLDGLSAMSENLTSSCQKAIRSSNCDINFDLNSVLEIRRDP
jgi:hypothetical protein